MSTPLFTKPACPQALSAVHRFTGALDTAPPQAARDEPRHIAASPACRTTTCGRSSPGWVPRSPPAAPRHTGWLRRFGVRAESVRVLFTVLLHALDACAGAVAVTASVFADALEVLGLAAAAAARLLGPRPAWQFASAASGGQLLGRGLGSNTS